MSKYLYLKLLLTALAVVVQWIVPAYEASGRWFNFQSGHMLGLWPRSLHTTPLIGGCVRGNHTLMFPSLPPFPSKNK